MQNTCAWRAFPARPLPLIFEEGSASCAMVYPRFVNGVRAHDYDPWANDQDWGLYCYMKYGATV